MKIYVSFYLGNGHKSSFSHQGLTIKSNSPQEHFSDNRNRDDLIKNSSL